MGCSNPLFEKMDCDEVTIKTSISDTLTMSAKAKISKNLQKLGNVNIALKNKLSTGYSEERKNKIAYSTEFCQSYNGYIDGITTFSRERKDKTGAEKRRADSLYFDSISKLMDLLYRQMDKSVGPEAPPPIPPPPPIEKPKPLPKSEPLIAHGYVKDEAGQGIPGVKIVVSGKNYYTSENGYYEIPFDAKKYKHADSEVGTFSKDEYVIVEKKVYVSDLDNIEVKLKKSN